MHQWNFTSVTDNTKWLVPIQLKILVKSFL